MIITLQLFGGMLAMFVLALALIYVVDRWDEL